MFLIKESGVFCPRLAASLGPNDDLAPCRR